MTNTCSLARMACRWLPTSSSFTAPGSTTSRTSPSGCPRNALICITGLSGSGKSSLAFDTIYAEGQRRYVESLSAYARQFLQMMEKPDVDSIDGLSPAISIDQKTTSRNPRSTVGTVTEIYDYLRLLYARVGRPHCPICGRPIAGPVARGDRRPGAARCRRGRSFTVNAPVVRDRKGEYRDVLEELRAEGFTRVKVDGEQRLLEEEIELDKKFKHTIEVVVDRLRDEAGPAYAAGAVDRDGGRARRGAGRDRRRGRRGAARSRENFACPEHGVSLPELQPRIFSFNSPHGACPRCTGLGAQQEIDPDLLVPDPSLSIAEGALVPWSVGNSSFYESVIQAIAERCEIDLDKPWQELPSEQQELFLYGTKGERDLRPVPQPDGAQALVHARVRGHRPEPRAALQGDRLVAAARADRGVHVVPARARRAAARGSSPRCSRSPSASLNIHEFTKMSVTRALEFLDELELTEVEQLIGARIVKEIRERLTFLDNVGVGYLNLDRASRDALGRRGAAAPAGDADRLAARRRPLHPRRAVDRPAPARQRQADRDARAAARPRQHRARRRARRADDARGRLARRHGPGRGRARRPRRRGGHGREGAADASVDHRAVPLGRARDRGAGAADRGLRLVHACAARRSTT